jgi:hypothetical protein
MRGYRNTRVPGDTAPGLVVLLGFAAALSLVLHRAGTGDAR